MIFEYDKEQVSKALKLYDIEIKEIEDIIRNFVNDNLEELGKKIQSNNKSIFKKPKKLTDKEIKESLSIIQIRELYLNKTNYDFRISRLIYCYDSTIPIKRYKYINDEIISNFRNFLKFRPNKVYLDKEEASFLEELLNLENKK